MLGIRDDGADIVGFTQPIRQAADSEEFVAAGDRLSTVADILGTRIRCIENAKGEPAGSTRNFATPRWVDDLPCVISREHVSIATASRDVEEAHSFHEKRTLFRKENRKTLVDLNL